MMLRLSLPIDQTSQLGAIHFFRKIGVVRESFFLLKPSGALSIDVKALLILLLEVALAWRAFSIIL
jgi:hypothetical protein